MLKTQLAEPDGTLRSLRWGMWHDQVLTELVGREVLHKYDHDESWDDCYDAGVEAINANNGEYTYTTNWVVTDPADGEILRVEAGCTFKRWFDSFKTRPLPEGLAAQ